MQSIRKVDMQYIFANASSVHSYNLRNSAFNWHIPRPRTKAAEASLSCYKGSIVWNKIPVEIRHQ